MPTRATDGASGDGAHLRLLCPQWQGAGTSSVRDLAAGSPWTSRGAATPSLSAPLHPTTDITAAADVVALTTPSSFRAR